MIVHLVEWVVVIVRQLVEVVQQVAVRLPHIIMILI
jgi:hypothetical protein